MRATTRAGLLGLLAAMAVSVARADEMVATRPGVMCRSTEALGRLTLPDGSSRSAVARPRPQDLRLKAEGGCIDIPPGARVTVLKAYHNTSSVTFDAGDGGGPRPFTVPNIDFTQAPATTGGNGAAAGPERPAGDTSAAIPAPSSVAPSPAPPASEAAPLAAEATPGACPTTYPGSAASSLPMVCRCDPRSVATGAVFGTDLYAFDSAPCRAARHAGVIGPDGGEAAFTPIPGARSLTGSDRNGVDSGMEANVPIAFEVRPASPAAIALIGEIRARERDPALGITVETADGRHLAAQPVPPPALSDATTRMPVPGVALSLPAADAVSLPVPPPPLAGGLPAIPWLPPQAPTAK